MVGAETVPTLSKPAITPRTLVFDTVLMVFVAIPVFLRVHRLDRFGAADVVALAVSIAFLAFRRPYPIPSLAVALVALVAITAAVERPTVLVAAVVVLLFEVATRHDRRTSILAGAATLGSFFLILAITARNRIVGPEALAAIAWPALAVAAGDALRQRRLIVARTIAEADARVQAAEASRAEEVRRHVAEERLRIARELHDVVAHRMAVVNVQAGVAAHLMHSRPDEADAALGVVRSSARTVLDELAGILSVLRTADEPDAPVEPIPRLADLSTLIGSFTDAGLTVTWETSGATAPLGDAAQLALYRTVQEALTNAHKHGDGAAHLTIEHTDSGTDVVVTNRISALGEPKGGFGLIGMRERVLAAGGTVETAADGDEFRVLAHFPRSETNER